MKVDSESPYHHTSPHEHDTKVIVNNENPFILAKDGHFMINMLNIDKDAQKEGKHGLSSPMEKKSSKVTDPPKQYLNMEDSINRNKSDDECIKALYCAPASGFQMVVKEDFYTDKIVTEVKLPEMRVCVEEDPSHIVKDIPIDKGVRSSEKSLVEKEEVRPMESSISNQTLDSRHTDLTKEMEGFAGANDLKYTVFDSSVIVDQDQADPASVRHNGFDGKGSSVDSFDNRGKLDTTASVISNTSLKVTENPADQASFFRNVSDGKGSSVSSNVVEGNLDTTESAESNISAEVTESPAVPISNVNNDCDGKGSFVTSIDYGGEVDTAESVVSKSSAVISETQLLSSPEIINTDSSQDSSSQILNNYQKQSVDVRKIQATSEESNSASTVLSFPSEVSVLSHGSKNIPANLKVPSGVITFSFDTETASTSGRDENKETTNSELVHNGPRTEEPMIDGATASTRYSFRQLMQGEANLCGPDLLSGPITNSGHIPYSGSISLRSDSSTTSTRSFAFPILQSEWNSSPVKMAKADRRHLRKHRGWRMGLLCCRF